MIHYLRKSLEIALAVTDAKYKCRKCWCTENHLTISISIAKNTPPSGVLNIAAMAAPDPAAVNTLLLMIR
ncbi:MAG: hypothetical protein MZV64_45070 [Ignavibacteriales bacterium]|nr:hypothetical protein [Ignavibacteriales bacterium]